MKSISEVLLNNIKDLTELEFVYLEINSAIYIKKINEKMQLCMKEISDNVDNQIKYYGQKIENYKEYKEDILEKYEIQFSKLVEEYNLQYSNILEEIGEAQANQKLSIANCKKLVNMREEFLDSDKYMQYIKIKEKYKKEMDDSLTKIEFDKNYERYHNLKNPIDDYKVKIQASIEKAKNYEKIIEIGNQKLEECLIKTIDELDQLVARKTRQIQIYNKNIFSKMLNKITNLFSGKKKLKIFVIDKSNIEIEQLEKDVVNTVENTRNNTISFIENVLNIKENLNNEFKETINV